MFATGLCLTFCEFFTAVARSLAEQGGGWWSTAELLLCACVPDQLNEPSKDGVLCFAAGGVQLRKAPHLALAMLESAVLSSQ